MSWISEKFLQLQTAFATYVPKYETVETANYVDLKVTELKALAKERGLKGYTTLRKAQLIEMLQQN